MRRFFSKCKNYFFVAPIAIAAADDGGCASTKPGPLSAEQVQSVIVGNTIAKVDHEAYACSVFLPLHLLCKVRKAYDMSP